MSKKGKSAEGEIEKTYQKKTQLEHILLRPDTYIGTTEKEKEEMTQCLRNLYLKNKTNMQIPITANKEDNINDLMFLANKELENKNNIILDLEEKVAKLDLKHVKEFSKDKLKEYKDFYTKNLKIINDALKQY